MAIVRSTCMARPYSNDLRRKFLQAYDEGEGTLEELAEQFRVSLGWAKKISARRTRTGAIDAPVWRHGPESQVTAAVQQWIRERVGEQPDLTLRELQQSLQESRHLGLSIGRIWLALRQIGLPRKKNRSTLRSKTASQPSSGEKRGGRR